MEGLDRVSVGRVDWPQVGCSAVTQYDIGFPMFRIFAVAGLIHHRLSLAKNYRSTPPSAAQYPEGFTNPHGPPPKFCPRWG
jgi:hypothetical protein